MFPFLRGCGVFHAGFRRASREVWGLALLAFTLLTSAHAAIQFDVFLGYDGLVPEASWFPVVCEIKNDGPSFTGVVELNPGSYNQGQTRRIVVELPTGTLKRFTLPAFSTTRGYSTYDARLLDERGKLRAEQQGLRARKQVPAGATLVGALTRTANGTPLLHALQSQQTDLQPVSARLLPSIFPDNPLVLEGMDSLYLNSEKASELKVTQVNALYGWIHAGGHLIVAVEQPGDVMTSPWLKALFPCDLKEVRTLSRHPQFHNWVTSPGWPTNAQFSLVNYSGFPRNQTSQRDVEATNPFGSLPPDTAFETNDVQVVSSSVREGDILLSADNVPLMVTTQRGRGRVTALLFSPEREPFRSWKHLSTFWARLAEVPGMLYTEGAGVQMGGLSSDGIFGAMIDTKQVHKLPVEWLLLLLIVYLVVIGPLDQYWLKKIRRPMLTWITFPCYVVLFSLLIYFIGYKLRSGESEWNEVHLVDVLLNGDKAEMRGRTYASVYSPSNQRYLLEGNQKFATLRGEFVGSFGGGQTSEKATVMQNGDSFKGEVFVPVWTSELLVSDWWEPGSVPLDVTVDSAGEDQWRIKVENRTETKLVNAHIAVGGYLIPLGELPPKEPKTFLVGKDRGTPIKDFAWRYGQSFHTAAQSRQRSFGPTESGWITDLPNSTIAASFISQISANEYGSGFLAPPGLDMSSVIKHGGAVLFAWSAGYSPVKPMYQFVPRRSHKDTLWRVPVKLDSKSKV